MTNSPLPSSGPIADLIASQLAKVGKSSSVGVLQIPAGESRTHKATGAFAYILDATTGFKLRMDGQAYVDARAGTSLETAKGAFFEWLEILNTSAIAITVKIFTGFCTYRDERLFNLEPLTDAIGFDLAGNQIDASGTASVPDRTDENVIRRKALIVSNEHASQVLYLLDKNANRLGTIWPRSTAIFHTAGPVSVVNLSATVDVPAVISEIYWVFYPFPVLVSD